MGRDRVRVRSLVFRAWLQDLQLRVQVVIATLVSRSPSPRPSRDLVVTLGSQLSSLLGSYRAS